jgi:hypothetical protein
MKRDYGFDHRPGDPEGVWSVVSLPPNDATLRVRRGLERDVVIGIENGTTHTETTAYLSPTAARLLGLALDQDGRGPAEADTFGAVTLRGDLLILRCDGRDADRVALIRPADRAALAGALELFAYQAEQPENEP